MIIMFASLNLKLLNIFREVQLMRADIDHFLEGIFDLVNLQIMDEIFEEVLEEVANLGLVQE